MTDNQDNETARLNRREQFRHVLVNKEEMVAGADRMLDRWDGLDGAPDGTIHVAIAVQEARRAMGAEQGTGPNIPADAMISKEQAMGAMRQVADLMDLNHDGNISGDEMLNAPPAVKESIAAIRQGVPGLDFLK